MTSNDGESSRHRPACALGEPGRRGRAFARVAPSAARALPVLAGAALVVALQLVAIRWQSMSADEPYHLLAGHNALRYGTNAVNLEHPPLVKLLAALPLASLDPPYAPPARVRTAPRLGERLFDSPERTRRLGDRARGTLLLTIGLPLIAACVLLGRSWADRRTGLLLGLAIGLAPATLPLLSLVLTDAAVALGFVLTLLAGGRFLRRPGWGAAAAMGAAWGLALAAKFSAVLLVVTVIAALALAPFRGAGGRALVRRLASK